MTEEHRDVGPEYLNPRADAAQGRAPKFTDIISRHVQQATTFNKLLEKEQLWKERSKELARKHHDTGKMAVWTEDLRISSHAKAREDNLQNLPL